MKADGTPRTISVIVPTHNRADMLRETLDRILDQSTPATEVIVVDDGSTDETPATLAEYARRGVRSIRLDEPRGPLAARNVGTRATTCDLVAYCDNDDLWDRRFVETAMRLWNLAPNLTVAYSNFAIVRNGSRTGGTKFADAPPGYWDDARPLAPDLATFDESPCERMVAFQPFFPSCMVVDRVAFMAAGGWDEAVTGLVGCDFATALRMAENPPIGLMAQPLVGIRKHETNLSRNSELMSLGNARVLEHVMRTSARLRRIEPTVRANVAKRRSNALAAAFVRRDLDAVLEIEALIPPRHRTASVRAKAAIARLPRTAGRTVAAVSLWLGTLASGRRRVAPGTRTGNPATDWALVRTRAPARKAAAPMEPGIAGSWMAD